MGAMVARGGSSQLDETTYVTERYGWKWPQPKIDDSYVHRFGWARNAARKVEMGADGRESSCITSSFYKIQYTYVRTQLDVHKILRTWRVLTYVGSMCRFHGGSQRDAHKILCTWACAQESELDNFLSFNKRMCESDERLPAFSPTMRCPRALRTVRTYVRRPQLLL
jgi:hypothetical protein